MRTPGRAASLAAVALITVMTAGAAALSAATGPGSSTVRSAPPRRGTVSAPTTSSTEAPLTTSPLVPPTPSDPPPPGPVRVNSAAWGGHGELAFVSSGQLDVLSNVGTLTEVTGPDRVGYDSNPAWSPDGSWLAFLHTGPANGYEVPAPTLWLVEAGSTVAHEVTPDNIGMFSWSPNAAVIAYTVEPGTNSISPSPKNLWTDVPGSAPVNLQVADAGFGVGTFAWSPDGSKLAYDNIIPAHPATSSSPSVLPTASIDVVDASGGSQVTAYELTETDLRLAGWWPSGGGLLFWEDPGFSESADGLMLYSLRSDTTTPVPLVTTLVGSTWLSPAPTSNAVAVVAGAGRTIWSQGRHVDICRFPQTRCTPVPVEAGTVALAPGWTASGALTFSVASASGPFGPKGDAYYSQGWMARWEATNTLWTLVAGGQPKRLASAPTGAMLAAPGERGNALIVVASDSLWIIDPDTNTSVRVAGPLYSTTGPSGYYGEVDWKGTFSWSLASGIRQGTAQLLGQALAGPESQVP